MIYRFKKNSLLKQSKNYSSPFYSNGRFHNFEEDDKTLALRSFQKFIKWKWFTPLEKPDIPRQDWLTIEEPPLVDKISEHTFNTVSNESLRLFWLGHSTLWLTICQKNQPYHIVIDPVLGSLSYVLKRLTPLPIRKSLLPSVDLILITHAHRDHLDLKSIRYLIEKNPKLTIIAPEGTEYFLKNKMFRTRLKIVRWYEKMDFFSSMKVHFLPAQHWSQMRLNDFLQIHWGSYAISVGERKLYFAGDTAYAGHFRKIADLYSQRFDVAVIPIGAFKPRSFMRTSHISPEEALQAFMDIRGKCLYPIHWGTFTLGDDLPQEAIYHLRHYANNLYKNDAKKYVNFWRPGQWIDLSLYS